MTELETYIMVHCPEEDALVEVENQCVACEHYKEHNVQMSSLECDYEETKKSN